METKPLQDALDLLNKEFPTGCEEHAFNCFNCNIQRLKEDLHSLITFDLC